MQQPNTTPKYKPCSSTYAAELTLFARLLYPDLKVANGNAYSGTALRSYYLIYTYPRGVWNCQIELSKLYDEITKHE